MDQAKHNSISLLITDDQSHTLYSERFKASYHSTRGAMSESQHVFIQNGLQYVVDTLGLKEISILEVGFGTGLNAFTTYLFAKEKGLKINYHTIEAYPLSHSETTKLNYTNDFSGQDKSVFNQMHQLGWNSKGLITDSFVLTKHLCLIEHFVSEEKFHLIYFDAFSPSEQPDLWTEAIFSNMHHVLNQQGVLVTYCAQGQMKRYLKKVGFKVQALPGALGKREMTRALKLAEN